MDEKKTGKIGRTMGWLLSILLIAGLAAGVVRMYPVMMRESRELYTNYVEEQREEPIHQYSKNVLPLVYGMYVDWCRSVESSEISAGEALLGKMEQDYAENSMYTSWYEKQSEILQSWYENGYAPVLEEYQTEYLIYREGEPEKTCGTLQPSIAMANTEEYPFFVQIRFNQSGTPEVMAERGINNLQQVAEEVQEQWVKNSRVLVNYEEGTFLDFSDVALANMMVFIGCKADLCENVTGVFQVPNQIFYDSLYAMTPNYAMFLAAVALITLILGLILPGIRPLGLKEGWKANIPVEIIAFAGTFLAYLVVEEVSEVILSSQIEIDYKGSMVYWGGIMEELLADGRDDYFIRGVNWLLWFGILLCFYLLVISLRQILSKGIWRFLKENTLTGKIICLVTGWIKKLVTFCGEIDFDNKGNRGILLFIVLNAVVIALFSCTWFIGILLAVPYSLALLWQAQKKWKKIRTDYEVLLVTTKEMAEGVTDVEYISEAGIFHELRDALIGVQNGFHTAVQDEVKSQKMKTELITNVSHDLKTPLTAIITYVDLLKDEELSLEERQNYIKILEQKSFRLKSLIEDLFEVSKATSGNITLDKINLDLVQLIQEVQLNLEDEIMNSGIEFKTTLPEEKVMVHLDAQKTCRIFENLMGNIIKHGLSGSRAYISMEQTETQVEVIVKNISAAEINYDSEEIMERFTRGDASRNTEGSGLGLAIVKSFAEAQGGQARVELDGDLFKVVVGFPKSINEVSE